MHLSLSSTDSVCWTLVIFELLLPTQSALSSAVNLHLESAGSALQAIAVSTILYWLVVGIYVPVAHKLLVSLRWKPACPVWLEHLRAYTGVAHVATWLNTLKQSRPLSFVTAVPWLYLRVTLGGPSRVYAIIFCLTDDLIVLP